VRIVIATTSGFHLRHLARELLALGRDVTYMTYLPKFRIRRDGIALASARSHFLRLQPWSTAALFRHLPALQMRAVEALLARTDAAFARDLPPCDVFIGLSAMAVESARTARRKYGAKVIIERGSRHVSSQQALLSATGGGPLGATYVERELAGYELADYIALPSRHSVESFLERGFEPARLFRNPYGVDFAAFSPTPRPAGPLRLLFVGAWSFRKGCDILERLLAANPDLALTHVGSGGDVPLPALANFVSVGHRTHRELRDLMASHHILLLPSREDGFGMVLIEALACGLPVVASAMTGAPDLKALIAAGDAVKVVAPADVEALASAVRDAAEFVGRQPPDRRILAEADVANLSWGAYARRYDAFLRRIV
jgi:glycosyltransferase involved in cell wall biosynthesis